MIEGGVWGGAFEAAMACDIVVAAANATFALTPAKLGVAYNVSGMLTFLNRARRCAGHPRRWPSPRARSRPSGRSPPGSSTTWSRSRSSQPMTYAIAADIVENAPLSIAVMKEELRLLAGAHPMSPQGWERVQGLRRVVYDSADYVEGLTAFKEKRKPVYRGE